MQSFLKSLRRAVNHVSDSGHSALHKEIKVSAERHFSGIRDEEIEEWLHTEDLHASGFPNSGKPKKGEEYLYMSNEDLRADTDRILFEVLDYIRLQPKYKKKLEAFRHDMTPILKNLNLTPDFRLKNLDSIPWDAAHVFHTVLAHNFDIMAHQLIREKIMPAYIVNNYRKAAKRMDDSYWTFGGDIFANDLKNCNAALYAIQDYLNETLKKPSRIMIVSESGARCSLPELCQALLEHIEELLASV